MGTTSSAGTRLLSAGQSLLMDATVDSNEDEEVCSSRAATKKNNVGTSTAVYPKHPPPRGKSDIARWSHTENVNHHLHSFRERMPAAVAGRGGYLWSLASPFSGMVDRGGRERCLIPGHRSQCNPYSRQLRTNRPPTDPNRPQPANKGITSSQWLESAS